MAGVLVSSARGGSGLFDGFFLIMVCRSSRRLRAQLLLFEQAIEFQLEHVEQSVAAIYNRDGRLRERTKMMQHWAHKIDELRDDKAKPKRGLKVVAYTGSGGE